MSDPLAAISNLDDDDREMIERIDDWANTMASIGGPLDKMSGMDFARRGRLTVSQLDALYEQNAIAARVVDRIADDAFRAGWRLSEVTSDVEIDTVEIEKRLHADLKIDAVCSDALKLSRLYGGALIALGVNDRNPSHLPIDLASASSIATPIVVTATDAVPNQYDSAWGSSTYQQVLQYQIDDGANLLDLHHSRVVRFEPISIPFRRRIENFANGWGPSVLDRLFDDLKRDGAAGAHAAASLFNASILFLQINGYRDAAKTKDGQKNLEKFLRRARENLDVLRILGLDKEDSLGTVSHTIPGIDSLLDKMRDRVAAAAEMPREILFNESPAGLNAGELSGPQEIWFARVSAEQEDKITPAIRKICDLAFAAWGLPIRSYSIEWQPLWTRSEDAEAQTSKTNAESDRAYFEIGAVSADEIREHRFIRRSAGPLELEPDALADPLAGEPSPVDLEAYRAAGAAQAEPQPSPSGIDLAPALEVVRAVTAGEIPRDAGEQLLAAAGYSPALLGSAGIVPETSEQDEPDVPLPDDAVSVQEAAQRLAVPTATITAAIKRGELRYWGIGKRRTVSLREVADLSRSHEAPAQPEEAPSGGAVE